MASVVRIIENLSGVRPEERFKTFGMFAYLLMVVGSFITGRIARDSLFLSRYHISYLPVMYAWVAGAMVLLIYTYSRFADRFRRDRLVFGVTLLLLLGTLCMRGALFLRADWLYPVLYVYVEVMGGLMMIQFWTFANDIFTTREAKRLFGIVGSGGVVASILAGFSIVGVAKGIGTENLLFLCAALNAGCLIMVSLLSRSCRRELLQAMAGKTVTSKPISFSLDLGNIFSSRYLKSIAWLTILCIATVTIVDYQFKIVARYHYLNREDQLSQFFGWFYGLCGIISLFVQLFVSGRLLPRFGIIVALMLAPLTLGLGSGLFLALPFLFSATLIKGADNILRYTIHESSVQVLYAPVSGRFRGRTRAFIDGIIKPMTQGITGLCILWAIPVLDQRVQWLSPAALLFIAGWLLLLLTLKKEYVRSLILSLQQRKMHFGESNFSIADSQMTEALIKTLQHPDEKSVLHAMEMIPFVRHHNFSKDLQPLLRHPSPNIRQSALLLLKPEDARIHCSSVLELFQDKDEDVRAQAASCYCAMLKDKAMQAVGALLTDSSAKIRANAIVGLMKYGGLDGILSTAEHLRALAQSNTVEDRKLGAWVIGKIGTKTLFRNLIQLLGDPDPSVRAEAVHAAASMRSPELILPLLQRLDDPATRRQAIVSLASYGSALLITCRTVLNNQREKASIRHAIPSILSRINDPFSMALLSRLLESEEPALRSRAVEAILQLTLHFPKLRHDAEMLRRSLHRELKDAYQLVTTAVELAPFCTPLLFECIEHRRHQTIERILKLLRVLYPGRGLDVTHWNLANPTPAIRANAIEILDNVTNLETRRCLLPLLENRDLPSLVFFGRDLFPLLHRTGEGWLSELINGHDEWTIACALDAVRQKKLTEFEPIVTVLLAHPSPLIRESALFSIRDIASPIRFDQAARSLAEDPHPPIRQLALCLHQASTA
jgi:ATP/ADP translocase/HEAT repeat protein